MTVVIAVPCHTRPLLVVYGVVWLVPSASSHVFAIYLLLLITSLVVAVNTGSDVMHYLLHIFHSVTSCGWWILDGEVTVGRLTNNVTQMVIKYVFLLSIKWHLMARSYMPEDNM